MCSQKIIDKIDSGKYVVVPKWLAIVRNIVSPITLVIILITIGGWKNDLESKTFKDSEEKENVLNFVKAGHPTTETKESTDDNHIKNTDIHRSLEEQLKTFVPRTEIEIQLINLTKEVKRNNDLILNLNK